MKLPRTQLGTAASLALLAVLFASAVGYGLPDGCPVEVLDEKETKEHP